MNKKGLLYLICFILILSVSINIYFAFNKKTDAQHKHEEVNDFEKEEEHGHGHGNENSQDITPEELFSKKCEHDILQFECDECRYELGVVKISQDILDKKLVTLQQASLFPTERAIVLNGLVEFDSKGKFFAFSTVDGVVAKLFVRAGDKVKKGASLVEIFSSQLAEIKGTYLENRAELALTEKTFTRMKELFESKLVSEKEFYEAETNYKMAEIRLNSAKSALIGSGFNDSDLQNIEISQNAGKLSIKSPADGIVNSINVFSGEHVDREKELVEIGNTDEVFVIADIYEKELLAVESLFKTGKPPAIVTASAYKDEIFKGTLHSLSLSIDEKTRRPKARILVTNNNGKLKPGQFVSVKLFSPETTETIAVPYQAVMSDEGRDFVFIHYKDDYYLRRNVQTGKQFSKNIEIISGLEKGEKFVVDGAFLCKSDILRSKMGAGCAE
jgi:cobalt-zinc-cadmium efflux system membrane fusion protein